VGDRKTSLAKTGIAKPTRNEITILAHFSRANAQQFTLVRIRQPEEINRRTASEWWWPHWSTPVDRAMLTARKCVVAIYVDWANGQWVVRDSDGDFWSLPATDTPWDDRQPWFPDEETVLEPVPGHYKYMLGLLP